MDKSGIENLKYAIVRQAIREYTVAFKKWLRKPDDGINNDRLKELRKFFFGDWYKILCDIDAEWLIRRLEEKVRKERKKQNA